MIKELILKLKIHPLFWLVLAAGILTGHFREVIMIFSIVFIHEMGHGIAAHFFHWRIKGIELLPFGGVAETDEHGNRALVEELIVTIAGPFQHFLLGIAGYMLYVTGLMDHSDYEMFMYHNLTILFFNLLPIWPLDGGKLLQIVCARYCSYKRALTLSLSLSLLVLLLFTCFTFFLFPFHLNLTGILLFLWISHFVEWRRRHYVYMRFLMGRYYAVHKRPLKLKPIVVNNDEHLSEVLSRFQKGVFHTVVVKDPANKRIVFEESKLLQAFFEEKKVKCAVGKLFR